MAFSLFRLATLWRAESSGRLSRRCAGLLAMVVLGLGSRAVSCFTFAEWLQFVFERERFSAEEATSYSLPPNRLATLVAPFWFGGSTERPEYSRCWWSGAPLSGCFHCALTTAGSGAPDGTGTLSPRLGGPCAHARAGENSPLYSPLLTRRSWVVRRAGTLPVLAVLALALLAASDSTRFETARAARVALSSRAASSSSR